MSGNVSGEKINLQLYFKHIGGKPFVDATGWALQYHLFVCFLCYIVFTDTCDKHRLLTDQNTDCPTKVRASKSISFISRKRVQLVSWSSYILLLFAMHVKIIKSTAYTTTAWKTTALSEATAALSFSKVFQLVSSLWSAAAQGTLLTTEHIEPDFYLQHQHYFLDILHYRLLPTQCSISVFRLI